jgi:hypothetical protein
MRDLLAIGATSKLVFPRIEVFNTWDERTKTYNFSFVVDE